MDFSDPNPTNRPGRKLNQEMLTWLERGGAVITANARAARSLRRAHSEAQRAAGKMAWPTPPIHDWESWLGTVWKQHLQSVPKAPLLLTPLQERAVWKRIANLQSGNAEAIAELAAEARKLLSDFDAHGQRWWPWRGRATPDAEAFRQWAEAFDRESRRKQWISRSDLPLLLVEPIQRGQIAVPAELLFIGFDRITPAQQALIDAAQAAGVAVSMLATPDAANAPQRIEATDMRDELTTCAWWARRILEANPAARIAVIVQDIDSTRGEIERDFRLILMPESTGIEASQTMPFEFSLGRPLATVPVVSAALLLLRWVAGPLEQAAISWLIISGFLAADGEDPGEMASLDAEIRKYGRMPPEAPLDAFASYRARTNFRTVGQFLRRLQRIARTDTTGNQRKTFPEWMDRAESLLREAGWPGARALESAEFQALARWERFTGDIAALGFDGGRVTYQEFVTALDRYANETIFSPESQDAPIQIMGGFESSGQEFDAIWFVGADDRQWPPTSSAHPLLPLWLQRNAAMPHASLDVDWELALEITTRIAASAPHSIFSHSQRDESGELRPSALLTEAFGRPLQCVSSAQLRATLHVPEQVLHRSFTMPFEDDSQIPWPRELDAGGADILKHQSACAFRSFAIRRFGAEDLAAAERGLTPRDRGNILHKVLEALWSKANPQHLRLQGRDDLINAKASGHLAEILDEHIQRVFKERANAYEESSWRKQYLAAEQERLQRLLLGWLDYEADRRDFTVEGLETEVSAEINGLKLKLRVDRIDQVEGGRLILDYKTGKVSPSMWEGDRPDDPQLPIYAIRGPVDDLRGLLFAQIRAGDMKFAGRVQNATETLRSDLLGNSDLVKKPLNQDQLNEWANALSNLADQFLAGDAAVAPKSYPKTCKYCALDALCRVSETPVVLEVSDDADSVFDSDDSEGSDADD